MSKRKGNGNNEDIGLGCSEPEELRQSITKADNSRKSVTWSAVPDAPKLVYVGMRL